jgi:two-component system chemotaxis response regulator CheY
MSAKYKALVVDDSAIIRRIFSVMLARLGFATFEADTVSEALALCEKELPDVALIDCNLPDEDGIALVQQLRRLAGGEKIKLIMCTVERSVTHIENALAAGADEYITKPFGIEVLETKLGYLGFDVIPSTETAEYPLSPSNARARRLFSRMGFAGMTVAEDEESRFKAGDVIFRQNDMPDYAYILIEGTVDMSCLCDNGSVTRVTLHPFELIGDVALIDNSPRRTTATAATDCTLMRISRSRFQAELDAVSPFMRTWVESLTDQLARYLDFMRERS